MKQLSLIEKAFFLKKITLFQELDLDLLVAIADKINQDIYDKKEKVYEINHRPKRMYLIAQGAVELKDDQGTTQVLLSTKDFFGDESLFSNTPRSYIAVCKTDTLLLTLSKNNLITIISECPTVAISLLQRYAKKLNKR